MSYSSDLSPKNLGTDEDEVMYVITRTGRREALDTNQITKRLQSLINRSPKIPHVNPYELMLEVCKGLKSGITTYEIDEYAANASASLSITNPYYLKIAARIVIDNHQKNTQRSFVDKMRKLYLNQDDQGKINSLIAQDFFKYVEEHQDFIERTIDYNRDFYLDFFGFQTFTRSYSMKVDEKPIERPQDMFMRTAIDLHMNTCDTVEEELQNIKTTYEALSLKFYTHASPTYYNAGSEKKQYASCFLLGTHDSREGIMRTADHISAISKYSGGIGVHINCLRGTGAKIRGTNGRSSGIVPWLKIYNEVTKGFNQGGRRPGSAAFYIMPHHPDIMKFIEITRNGGTEEMRARAIFTSLWIPDIFMERVRDGALWSTFDPDSCGDLSDYTGEEYRKKYLELEEKKMYSSQIPARKIWEACMETNSDVGRLYVCFSDTANEMFMQKNLGVLKSSNLCVAPDTLILTENGYFPIEQLATTNNGQHIIWNGFELSKAQFAKTGSNKQLLKITFSDGIELKCTPEHKFATFRSYNSNSFNETKAENLVVGQKLIKHTFPVLEYGDSNFNYPYTHGFFCGDGTIAYHPTLGITCSNNAQQDNSYCGHHLQLPPVPRRQDGKCAATCKQQPSFVDLYHEKKELLRHMDYTSYVECKEENRYRLMCFDDIADKFTVPSDKSKEIRLQWLAGYLDADGSFAKNGDAWSLQVSSINKDFLMQVKLLCNTLGTNPLMHVSKQAGQTLLPDGNDGSKMYDTKEIYRLCFSVEDSSNLYSIGLNTKRLQWNNKQVPMRSKKQYITVKSIEKLETKEDTYCFNEPNMHMGIFNGVLAMNCSEIFLYSNAEEYAVCILSSIALPTFVLDGYSEEELKQSEELRRKLNHEFPVNPYFDFKKLIEITKLITTNLNLIIDKTFHPLKETKRGNDRHRPIGIGVQGLDDCYAKMRYPFKSDAAHDLNKKIFETIYFAAITQSSVLARKQYQSLKKKCKLEGKLIIYEHQPDSYNLVEKVYNSPEEIPQTAGSYPSMLWNGGSPIGNGIFHWELAGLTTDRLSGMFDWESLREHVKTFGVRNSLTVACMPTASTSQLLGNNESVEPYTSNIYKRNTLAGEYIVVKKHLMDDLYRLGLWSSSIKDYLLASNGSIQHIDGIPDNIKELYPTVWEIDQEVLVQQAIDRQPFVDQGQSLNLYVENLNMAVWNKLMFKAWKGKLKTGKYYLHSRPAVTPQKFTIDPSKQEEMRKLLEKNKHGTAFMESLREVCEVCSS